MTDERFVFQQDVKERSKMKTGAFHKKNGCKSKKCTLPSDRLTASQKKKLNGECMSIKMNEPYHNWKDFKRLSIDMQRNYISNLVVEHHARSKDIAEMFNVSPTTFSQYCIKFNPRIKFNGGRVMDEKWLDFITKPAPKKAEKDIVSDSSETADELTIGIDKEPVSQFHFAYRYRHIPDLPKDNLEKFEKSLGIEHEELPLPEKCPSSEDILTDLADKANVESANTLSSDLIFRSTQPAKQVSGYNAMVKMSLDLKGSKEEIMQMMNTVLGDECSYIVSLKISNITNSQEVNIDETVWDAIHKK